ncbi:glutamate-ammonia-ligase adenylyltransferase [mine drainage metagenome]|uniref:Glutamate-ammonia-ligase adenylyltransferase n=1 Tax=mine drainage metagenome TaxID=410659 RepID=A0A1J5QCE0_9ZZZZ
MRQKMLDGHPNNSELFDLKHDRGGIVDVEFIVQYLLLAHAARYPQLADNIGNLALLKRAGELGLIPGELASRVAEAYRDYRRLQHTMRLQGSEKARVPTGEIATHAEAVQALWQQVFTAGS